MLLLFCRCLVAAVVVVVVVIVTIMLVFPLVLSGIPPIPGRRTFAVIIHVLQDYIAPYDDMNSSEALAFVADFTSKMNLFLINNLPNFVRISVNHLFRGSVGVGFDIEVDGLSIVTEDTIFDVLEDGAVNGTLALNLTSYITVQEVLLLSSRFTPSPSISSTCFVFISIKLQFLSPTCLLF